MEAIIINYRGSHKTHYPNHMILKPSNSNSKEEAKKLVNKKVIWITPSGKEMIGIVKKEHGNKGAVRVIFEKGLPGQAIGTKAKIE